jgi:hypothetical protein
VELRGFEPLTSAVRVPGAGLDGGAASGSARLDAAGSGLHQGNVSAFIAEVARLHSSAYASSVM